MEITFCWWENPSNCIKPTSTRKPSNYVRTCPTACGSTAHHARSQKRRPEPMKRTSPWRKQQQSHCMCFSTQNEDMAFTTTSFHCLALNKKTLVHQLVIGVVCHCWCLDNIGSTGRNPCASTPASAYCKPVPVIKLSTFWGWIFLVKNTHGRGRFIAQKDLGHLQ